jgi:hypothetical protein
MKWAVAAAITLILISYAAGAAAGVLELKAAGAEGKKTKPNEIVSAVFEARFSGTSEQKFKLDISNDSSLSLISGAGPVTLSPGMTKKIVLLFLVAGDASDKREMPVAATLTSQDNPATTASAGLTLIASASACAQIDARPQTIAVAAGDSASLHLILHNCGDSRESFVLDIPDSDFITVRSKPDVVTLMPGESAQVAVELFAAGNTGTISAAIPVKLMKKGLTIAETSVPFKITGASKTKQPSHYEFINLNMKLEHMLITGNDARTSIQFSIPLVRDNDLTFKSNVWMNSRDSKMETRRQNYELGIRDNRIVIGNQQYIFSKALDNSTIFEGRLIERRKNEGVFSLFSGSDGFKNIKAVKWEHPLTPRISIGAGHIVSETAGAFSKHINDDRLNAIFRFNSHLSFDAEVNSTKTAAAGDAAGGSGLGAQIGGKYQGRSIQVSAQTRDSRGDFATNGYFKGVDFHADYDLGASRAYLDYRDRFTFRESPYTGQTLFDSQPMKYKNALAGYVMPIKKHKATVSFSLNVNDSDLTNTAFSDPAATVKDDAFHIGLMKQFDAFRISVGAVAGRRSAGEGYRNYHEYDYSAKYSTDRTEISAGLTSTIDFYALDSELLEGHNFSLNVGHMFPNEKTYFQIGWRKDMQGSRYRSADITSHLIARLNTRISKADRMEFVYDSVKSSDKRINVFSVDYTRDISLKIPFKKYGSVSGIVFEDRNRDGAYDSGDVPVKNALVHVGSSYSASTESDGKFDVRGILPGKYDLILDSKSYPVGFSQTNNSKRSLVVKSAGKISVELPLQRVLVVSGRISIDQSNYFSKHAKISPNQLKVELFKDGAKVAETFTDQTGKYYFESMSYGIYAVTLNPEWIPLSASVVGENARSVDCTEGKPCESVDFIIGAKKKAIIKTLDK